MQAKLLLATGDDTAAEDGINKLAVARRQSAKFWTPAVSGAPALWQDRRRCACGLKNTV